MKKLFIVSAGFLFVAGFISLAWAHGPKGGGFGFRGHSVSKPHFSRPSHPRTPAHFNRHFRHQRPQRNFGHKPHFQHQRFYWNYWRFYGPYAGTYGRGYKDSLPLEETPQVPQHSSSSRIYYDENPEPWFLYGKGKEFRQMGLIPPRPQTSGD